MDIILDKSLCGSSTNFRVIDNELVPTTECSENDLVVGPKEYNDLIRLYLLGEPKFPPKNYLKALQSVSETCSVSGAPWAWQLPNEAYRRLLVQVWNDLSALDLTYYTETFLPGNKVLSLLQPPKIDIEAWKQVSGDPFAKTFQPDDNGFAEPVEYDRCATVSGRLKVISGPNILHLNKSYRNIIKSRWEDGEIISLDYSSLEPRVLLGVEPNQRYGEREERDLYEQIRIDLFSRERVSRSDVKQLVLSELYGASFETLMRDLPHVERLENVLERIKEFFGVDRLKPKLVEQAKRGYLLNFYKRKVSTEGTMPYMLLNRFVQSTAVDVAMIGFSNICSYLEDLGRLETVVPLFVLHDALILDVNKFACHVIPTLCKIGAGDIPGFKQQFYLKKEKLCQNKQ